MSEQTSTAPARKFRTVNGKPISEAAGKPTDGENTEISYVRPAQLAKDGTTGNVAEGVYEGTIPDRYDESKNNFKIRANDGSLIIVNNSGSLNSQMARVEVGSYVILEYLGQDKMSSGPMKGKLAHRFLVKVAETE